MKHRKTNFHYNSKVFPGTLALLYSSLYYAEDKAAVNWILFALNL